MLTGVKSIHERLTLELMEHISLGIYQRRIVYLVLGNYQVSIVLILIRLQKFMRI